MRDKSKRITIAATWTAAAFISVVAVWAVRDHVFYSEAKQSLADAWRALWMIPFLAAGLAVRAWVWREFGEKLDTAAQQKNSPWKAYFAQYPAWIISGCILVFAGMHSFLDLSNWLYYPSSAVVSFTLARAPGLAPQRIGGFAGGKV